MAVLTPLSCSCPPCSYTRSPQHPRIATELVPKNARVVSALAPSLPVGRPSRYRRSQAPWLVHNEGLYARGFVEGVCKEDGGRAAGR
eukprot:1065678-Amorphochlora_amoeboformis.AAC.1